MPDDGFLNRMRMSGIYSLPSASQSDVYRTFMDEILPILRQDEQQRSNILGPQEFNTLLNQQIRTRQALDQIGKPAQPNVVYQPPLSDTIAGRKMELAEKTQAERNAVAMEQLGLRSREADIKQQGVDIRAYLAENPNHKIMYQNGRVIAVDPQTNNMVVLGQVGPTEMEKIGATGQNRLNQIAAAGKEARETATLRGDQTLTQIALRGNLAAEAANLTANQPYKPASLPTQQATAIKTRYNQLMSQHPEYSYFVEVDPNSGLPMVKAPGRYGFGSVWGGGQELTPELAKQLNDALYGTAPIGGPSGGVQPSGKKEEKKEEGKKDPLGIRK